MALSQDRKLLATVSSKKAPLKTDRSVSRRLLLVSLAGSVMPKSDNNRSS
jgi:hypothetical protein